MTSPDVPVFTAPIALYAGSFDPVTHGHEDLITRSLAFAGRLVVAVAHNPNKQPLFSVEERVGFIRNGEAGASPDSLLGANGLLEIKTKLPHLQLEVLLSDAMPTDHRAQVQGQLWIAEREWCDFVSYWPRLPLFVKRIHRDEAYIKTLQEGVAVFLAELHDLQAKFEPQEKAA